MTRHLICYDLETTDTDVRSAEIIQIGAAVCTLEGEILDTFERKVVFAGEVLHTESVYRKDVWDVEGVLLEQALTDFRNFCVPHCWQAKTGKMGGVYNAIPPLTYNGIHFDHNFLIRDSQRLNVFVPLSYPGFDLYSMLPLVFNFRSEDGRPASFRLQDVCDWYGIELRKAHDALADVKATCQLLPHVWEDLRCTGWLSGSVS